MKDGYMRRALITKAWRENGVIKCSTLKTKKQPITLTFNYKFLNYHNFDPEIFVGMKVSEIRKHIFDLAEKQRKLEKLMLEG